jgi:hypothetical protein
MASAADTNRIAENAQTWPLLLAQIFFAPALTLLLIQTIGIIRQMRKHGLCWKMFIPNSDTGTGSFRYLMDQVVVANTQALRLLLIQTALRQLRKHGLCY